MIGSHIEAGDGSIGHVEDCLVDEKGWRMRYLVIDTGRWLPGRKVIVAPNWIRAVSWRRERDPGSHASLIKSSPPYESSASLNGNTWSGCTIIMACRAMWILTRATSHEGGGPQVESPYGKRVLHPKKKKRSGGTGFVRSVLSSGDSASRIPDDTEVVPPKQRVF